MGSPSVVFIIAIFLLVSLPCTHILIAGGSWEVQNLNFKEERGVGVVNEKKNQVEKVSGKDDNEDSETLLFQKVRALLGLRSSKAGSALTRNLSPSPSPSPLTQPEPPAPSPSPIPPVHKHNHFPLHHSKPKSTPLDKAAKQHTDNGRNKRVLVAVLFSSGAALIVCLLGLIWVMRGKIRRHKKAPFKTMSAHRKKARSRGKVSLNPGLDFLYLDALGRDIEQQTISLKQTSQASNATYERVESNQELISKPEICDNNTPSSSSTREIMSVHEQVELDSVNGDSVGGNASNGDKIIPTEDHCSDDESFHSFVDDPHSSSIRHSNASAASLSEASENSLSKISPSPPFNPTQLPKFEVSSPSDSRKTSTPPPPPPPPPPIPAPSTHFWPLKTSSKPTKPLSKSPGSSTPLKLPKRDFSPSPRNSPKLSGALPPSVPLPPLAPPPPPFLKGDITSSSIKGPPPPPSSQFPPPVGKDGAPLPKLKPLHWDKVRAAPDGNMVWDKIRSSSFEFDEEMIESLFGYNLQSPAKNEESKSKSPPPGKHVLDPKRLQNMTILSKAINSTAQQVCDALLRGDGLSQQQLEALAKMVPTKEEEVKLSGYKGNIDELGSAEKFVKVVLSVPFSFLRVEAMLYRETFEDEVVHLRNSFSMLEEACKELRSSRLFLKLLEAVLKTGNRMNVGTIRGGAKAFKLDALLKLADVKGADGKTTLLHFVVQEIIRSEGIRVSDSIMGKINQKNNNRKTPEEKEEDYKRMGLDLVTGLSTELYNVKKTATVDLELLAGSVSNFSDGMMKLKELVNELANNEELNGRFVGSMKGFIAYAERALKELREDEERVFLRVREVTEYFHGVNVSKDEANPLRIFVIVRDFLCMLDHVCKELRSFKVPSSPSPLAPFR